MNYVLKTHFPPGKSVMYSGQMNDFAGDSQRRQHTLSDWLALHELDPVSCRGLLDVMNSDAAGGVATQKSGSLACQAPDREVAWQKTAEAIRCFFPRHRDMIDDTFENSVKVCVEQRDGSRKALTLDNGPTAYPTILYSYQSEVSDWLVMSHEFAHALQIRASRGIFVSPVIREVCAFIGETALLSYTQQSNAAQSTALVQVWRDDNDTYFGAYRDRLRAALLRPDALYDYSWNYPVARYLSIEISKRCSKDLVWRVFEGEFSVKKLLRELVLI
jgi:hypothetical protein